MNVISTTLPTQGVSTLWGTTLNSILTQLDSGFTLNGTGPSVGLNVGIGNTIKIAGTLTITGAVATTAGLAILGANTFTATQTIQTTTGGNIVLSNTTAPGTSFISGGYLQWYANNASSVLKRIAYVGGLISDVTAGAENGTIVFDTVQAGAENNRLWVGAGIYTNSAASGDKGVDTFNAKHYYKDGVEVGLVRFNSISTSSGTSVDQNSIPAGANMVIVSLYGVSTNGTSLPMIQLGGGSITSSGYSQVAMYAIPAGIASAEPSTGFNLYDNAPSASNILIGRITFTNVGSNAWIAEGFVADTNKGGMKFIAGAVILAGTLDRVRLTTVGGTDTFDGGVIGVMYQ